MIITVVIPCYRSRKILKRVIKNIPKYVNYVILVDDKCPQNTVKHCLKSIRDKRIFTIFNKKNLGVGGSVIKGYRKALKLNSNIIVKVDSDGQMDLSKMKKLINTLVENQNTGYVKANRFYSYESISKIPPIRRFGNFVLTIVNKFSSGYWSINDPTNGYTAIKSEYCRKLKLNEIKKNFFFESDMLYHLYKLKVKVKDISIKSNYNSENSSNLIIHKIIPYFIRNHFINFFKRIYLNNNLLILYILSVFSYLMSFLYFDFLFYFSLFLSLITILIDILNEPK